MRLVELPNAGNWMKVELSLMMDLRSSDFSVTNHSNFLGRIAVSREMTDLLCKMYSESMFDANQVAACVPSSDKPGATYLLPA